MNVEPLNGLMVIGTKDPSRRTCEMDRELTVTFAETNILGIGSTMSEQDTPFIPTIMEAFLKESLRMTSEKALVRSCGQLATSSMGCGNQEGDLVPESC